MTYYEYRLRFPITGLARALQALAALRAAGVLIDKNTPDNMLGEPRDVSGAITSGPPAWRGSPGKAALSYVDPDTGQSVSIPACGDPAYYYIHVRSNVAPNQIPFAPSAYGIETVTPEESAAVLGVWA